MPAEGQTAINRQTGQRAVYRGGQWVVVSGAPQMPTNPEYPYKGPKAAADLGSTQANTQGQVIDNRVKGATAPSVIAKAQAEAQKAQADAAAAQALAARGGMTPEQFAEIQGRQGRLSALVRQINRVQELYDQGPGSTTPWSLDALGDYAPKEVNKRLDTAGDSLAQQGLAAFRVPGTGTVSDRDAIMFDRANLPRASNFDATTDEQLLGLRSRVEEEYRSMGLPRPVWGNGKDAALANAKAILARQIGHLPKKAQDIGWQKFYADPRIKGMMGKQKTLPQKSSSIPKGWTVEEVRD